MTGLLPEVVREGVESRSLFDASETFGVVTLVLLIVLLMELEALRAARRSPGAAAVLQALSVPLLAVVGLTIVLRVTGLVS